MTTDLFPIEPAFFDFDPDRADEWRLPAPRPFTPALSWWERVIRWGKEVREPFDVEMV